MVQLLALSFSLLQSSHNPKRSSSVFFSMIEQFLEPQVLGVLAVAVLVTLIIRWPRSLIFSSARDPTVKEVPGLPLLGNTLQIFKHRHEVLSTLYDWQLKYGAGGKPFTATLCALAFLCGAVLLTWKAPEARPSDEPTCATSGSYAYGLGHASES